MTQDRYRNSPFIPSADPSEHRLATERQRLQEAAERERSIADQSSSLHAPQRRIELWEHLHAIHLPHTADHRLVGVIAQQTALTVEQVRQEQLRRAIRTATSVSSGA